MEEMILFIDMHKTQYPKQTTKPTPTTILRQFYRSYQTHRKPKSQSNAQPNIVTKSKSSIKKFTLFLDNASKASRTMTERLVDPTVGELKDR